MFCYKYGKVDENLDPICEYDVGQVEGFRYSVGNRDFTKIFAIDDDEQCQALIFNVSPGGGCKRIDHCSHIELRSNSYLFNSFIAVVKD